MSTTNGSAASGHVTPSSPLIGCGRAGVENLAKALQETPKFGGEESQADVAEKLAHMRSMMTYLEASR